MEEPRKRTELQKQSMTKYWPTSRAATLHSKSIEVKDRDNTGTNGGSFAPSLFKPHMPMCTSRVMDVTLRTVHLRKRLSRQGGLCERAESEAGQTGYQQHLCGKSATMTDLYCKGSNTFQTPGVTPCWMRDTANSFLKLGGREEFSSRLLAPPRPRSHSLILSRGWIS